MYDIAVVLNVLAGADPADASTKLSAGEIEKDYTQFLKTASLKGARIGIARDFAGPDPETIRITDDAIVTLKKLGAIIVDPIGFPDHLLQMKQPVFTLVRNSEFKALIADYLKTLKPGYPRTLDELIAKASDPKTAYRSPEKLVGLKYSNSVGARSERSRVPGREERGLPRCHGWCRSHFCEIPVGCPGVPDGKPRRLVFFGLQRKHPLRLLQPARSSAVNPRRFSRMKPASPISAFPRA